MTFTEWGLWPSTRSPGGGGDDRTFMAKLSDWMGSHNVAYEIYNEGNSDHNLNQYPKAKADYKARFEG